MRFLCARVVHGQPRRPLSHGREDTDVASVGFAAMDLLRARLQGRRRDVWGRFYTELFFLDEPTALAAGHRPCFECRRKDAETFAEKWREARRLNRRPYAPEMDDVLHHERLRGGAKRLHRRNIDELPDGAFAAFDQTAFAIQGDTLLRWTQNGYHSRKPRPHRISVDVLTPPTILAVLSAGYKPRWHQSAKE